MPCEIFRHPEKFISFDCWLLKRYSLLQYKAKHDLVSPLKKLTTSMPLPTPRVEFTARYFVESSIPSEKVAEVIAGEQSSGTFMALSGETDALKERSRARVVRVDTLPAVLQPTLPSAFTERRPHGGVFHRAHIEIAFPVANVGANLPSLMAISICAR